MRRVLVDINSNGGAQTSVQDVRQQLAISTNAGASWTVVNPGNFNKVSNIAVGAYYSLTSNYRVDIPAGQGTRFAVNLGRYASGPVSGIDFFDLDCSIRAMVISRTSAFSPFDEDIQESPARD